MDFALAPDEQEIIDLVRDFAGGEVQPRAAEIDEKAEFPAGLVRASPSCAREDRTWRAGLHFARSPCAHLPIAFRNGTSWNWPDACKEMQP